MCNTVILMDVFFSKKYFTNKHKNPYFTKKLSLFSSLMDSDSNLKVIS